MLSTEMQEALNKQINEELFSAYLYASMSSYFEFTSLKGFAKWMSVQSKEEEQHAQRIVNYMHNRGARVVRAAIAAPQTDWPSPLAAFEDAYKHECHISSCINRLATLAIKESDHATHALMEWFVTEQVEEESNADQLVQQLRMIGDNTAAMFLVDREVGQRGGAKGGADEAAS
jgi:ferritin